MLSRKFGFTLAEVLVTLGIIGVVSAMTIPSLTQNWQKRAYVTQLHKAYSEMRQAFTARMNQKNALNLMEAGLNNNDGVSEFLKEQFKVVKKCSMINLCFADSYKNLNGGLLQLDYYVNGTIVTGSGVAISMIVHSSVDPDEENTSSLGRFWIDINGKKGPNILGRDLFTIYFYPDGSLDASGVPINCRKYGTNCGRGGNTAKETREKAYTSSCKSTTIGSDSGGCFGKILNDNWEMKY